LGPFEVFGKIENSNQFPNRPTVQKNFPQSDNPVTLSPKCSCYEDVSFFRMDSSLATANMDREMLKRQIENMKYQAQMERWPLSKSIAA
jgi:hypothetical protein